jgi:hypothetical protein
MSDDLPVTVVVPYHTQREASGLLARALRSVQAQTMPVYVVAAHDTNGQGAPATRHAGLMTVRTPIVAFLDSDDEMDPEHIEKLYRTMVETGADYVYSHYRVIGGEDPRPYMFGRPWNNDDPQQTTVVTMVRTELAKEVGFADDSDLRSPDRLYAGEDWRFTLGCLERGAKIVHHPEITWSWHHHGMNTSGLPGRGDAR